MMNEGTPVVVQAGVQPANVRQSFVRKNCPTSSHNQPIKAEDSKYFLQDDRPNHSLYV